MAWIPAWTHRPPPSAQRTSAGANTSGIQPARVMPPPGIVIAQPHMIGVVPPPMHLPPPPTLAMLTAVQRPPPPPTLAMLAAVQRPPPPPTLAMLTAVQRPPPTTAVLAAVQRPPPPTLAMLTAAQRPPSISVETGHPGRASRFGPPAPSHSCQISSSVPVVRPPNTADSLTTAQPKTKSPPAPPLPLPPPSLPFHVPQMPAPVPMVRPPTSENTTTTAQPKTKGLPPAPSPPHPLPLHPPRVSASLTPSRLYEIKTRIKVLHAKLQQELDKARRVVTKHETLREEWDAGGTDVETETASVMQRAKETQMPKTANFEPNIESDPEYISAIHNAKRLKEELENLNANLTPERLVVVTKKIAKALKRKEWKKRRIVKMQEYRDTAEERRQKLNAEIDRKCEKILARDKKKEKRKLAKQIAKQERRQEARKIAQGKQAVALVQKLQQLKTLRRERMKRAGHFFPEEDNEFFERIRRAEEVLKQPIEKRTGGNTNTSKKQKKQEIVNAEFSSAKVGMSPVQDSEKNAAGNISALDEILASTDAGTSKRKPCQDDAFEDSLQTGTLINQAVLPPTKMQKLGQGSSQQQQLLQELRESLLLPEKDQEQGHVVSLGPPTQSTPEQTDTEGSTTIALFLTRARREKLRNPITYRHVWGSYQVSQKDGLRKQRRATPIPDGLGAPPDEPSSLEWAEYLV